MFTGRRLWLIKVYGVEEIARFGDSSQDSIKKVNNVEQYKVATEEVTILHSFILTELENTGKVLRY
jgi:hypothetical protein